MLDMELPYSFFLCIYHVNKLTVPFSNQFHRAMVILIFRKISQVDCDFYAQINIRFRLFTLVFYPSELRWRDPLYELMVSTVTYRDLFSI